MFFVLVPFLKRAPRIIIHLARNVEKGGGVLMRITLPNLKHSFICPVPVPVPDSRFPDFPDFRLFFSSAIFGHKLSDSSHSSDHGSYFHPFTAASYSGLFTGFRRFVTSDFGGFAKSLDVFWLNDTLFGGKLGFSHCQFSTAVLFIRFIHR